MSCDGRAQEGKVVCDLSHISAVSKAFRVQKLVQADVGERFAAKSNTVYGGVATVRCAGLSVCASCPGGLVAARLFAI